VTELPQATYGAGASLEALHALRSREIEEWVQPSRDAGVPCSTRVCEGFAPDVLQRVADEMECEMIVVGRRGEAGMTEMLFGSVPHALTHRARRPVVVVPA
jgi:nucleotide-binding universal stress UspA family protein